MSILCRNPQPVCRLGIFFESITYFRRTIRPVRTDEPARSTYRYVPDENEDAFHATLYEPTFMVELGMSSATSLPTRSNTVSVTDIAVGSANLMLVVGLNGFG